MKLAAILSLSVLVVACAAPSGDEEEAPVTGGESALSSILDAPAVEASGAAPKVETVDLSNIDFDLASIKDARGNPDYARLKIDVLDTGSNDHGDWRTPARDLKWVESDKRELPSFVDKAVHGIDVGGGKCRIKSIGLKKLVVGCKWTW